MAYNTQTYITGQLIDSVDMNQLRDNMNTLALHNHGTALGSGHGSSIIGPLTTLLTAAAVFPSAPTAGVTVLWESGTTTFGALLWRSPDGSIYEIENSTHGHPAL